eukprot:scaffold6219_cov146-Cylindrotheca_fusiformis.AAC.16
MIDRSKYNIRSRNNVDNACQPTITTTTSKKFAQRFRKITKKRNNKTTEDVPFDEDVDDDDEILIVSNVAQGTNTSSTPVASRTGPQSCRNDEDVRDDVERDVDTAPQDRDD